MAKNGKKRMNGQELKLAMIKFEEQFMTNIETDNPGGCCWETSCDWIFHDFIENSADQKMAVCRPQLSYAITMVPAGSRLYQRLHVACVMQMVPPRNMNGLHVLKDESPMPAIKFHELVKIDFEIMFFKLMDSNKTFKTDWLNNK